MRVSDRLRDWARRIKRDLAAVAGAARDPRTPTIARVLAVVVVAYALSPIDLIPDVVPVLGLLDDVILVPLGLLLVIRLIPPEILAEHRARAEAAGRLPASRAAAAFVIALWLALLALAVWWVGSAL
ncbi:MAG TPA: DUF1232 domain-containing protein [Microvirga sp.]|jgi:uncharacterized membrane protein YkvA (DUF1232 family)|nr:DUF1232 domain-containing protein [Microvirga sp.]